MRFVGGHGGAEYIAASIELCPTLRWRIDPVQTLHGAGETASWVGGAEGVDGVARPTRHELEVF